MPRNRAVLALLTMAALVAATLAAVWVGEHLTIVSPAAAGLLAYTVTVWTLAHAAHLPPARTLAATVLLLLAATAIALRGIRAIVDVALWTIRHTGQAGVYVLATKGA